MHIHTHTPDSDYSYFSIGGRRCSLFFVPNTKRILTCVSSRKSSNSWRVVFLCLAQATRMNVVYKGISHLITSSGSVICTSFNEVRPRAYYYHSISFIDILFLHMAHTFTHTHTHPPNAPNVLLTQSFTRWNC